MRVTTLPWLALLSASALVPRVALGEACPQALLDAVAGAGTDSETDGVFCFRSADLTTNNADPTGARVDVTGPATTSQRNALNLAIYPPHLSVLPASAFAGTFSFPPGNAADILGPVPGWQIAGSYKNTTDDPNTPDDPFGRQSRFVARFPDSFQGCIVVGLSGSDLSEYNQDKLIGDHVIQKGCGYIGINKGWYQTYPTTPGDPLGCPSGAQTVRFYAVDIPHRFQYSAYQAVRAAHLGRRIAGQFLQHPVTGVYAMGSSNGGFVLRNVAKNPAWAAEFAGIVAQTAVTGTLGVPELGLPPIHRIVPHAELTRALFYYRRGLNPPSTLGCDSPTSGSYPAYSPIHPCFDKLQSLLYATEIIVPGAGGAPASYWDAVSQSPCRDIRGYDPEYTGDVFDYDYAQRIVENPLLEPRLQEDATTGDIHTLMIAVHGSEDTSSVFDRDALSYAALVAAAGKIDLFHLYTVQNAAHTPLPQLAVFTDVANPAGGLTFHTPIGRQAIDALIAHVEEGVPLPDEQCVPRGGSLVGDPRSLLRPVRCPRALRPLDKTAPVLTLAAPSLTNQATLLVTGTVADETEVQDVQLAGAASGGGHLTPVATSSSSEPVEGAVNATVTLAEGASTLTLSARDAAGNLGSTSAEVVVDTLAPTVAIVSPAEGQVVGASLQLEVNASDVHFTSLECFVGGSSLGAQTAPTLSQTVGLLGELDGELDVACLATDAAGNTGEAAVTVIVKNWALSFNPATLNLRSRGESVTVVVEGANVSLLVPAAGSLALRVGSTLVPVRQGAGVGDQNGNGIPDVTLKLDRAKVIAAAGGQAGSVTATLLSGSHALDAVVFNVMP